VRLPWRDPGFGVYVTIDRWSLAEELWLYGEDELAPRALDLGDDEMRRLYKLAGSILMRDEARSGAEAAALAAVELLEARSRPLARKRRRPRSKLQRYPQTLEERIDDVHRIEDDPDEMAAIARRIRVRRALRLF